MTKIPSACNEIKKIEKRQRIAIWLPIVGTFRTFAVCPPPVVRLAFEQIRALAAA